MAMERGRPDDYEYTSLRAESHEELSELLNDAAEHCWEPAHYAIWSLGTGMGTNVEKGVHFVILRRDSVYFQERLAEVMDAIEGGEYSDDEKEQEWARRFVERAREEGYVE
jgi:hypothetical protein